MSRMVRKQVYITPEQDIALKQRSQLLDVTESELIRRGIEHVTSVEVSAEEKRRLWEQELEYMRRRAELLVPPGTKPWKWNREELYEERIDRYPRGH